MNKWKNTSLAITSIVSSRTISTSSVGLAERIDLLLFKSVALLPLSPYSSSVIRTRVFSSSGPASFRLYFRLGR